MLKSSFVRFKFCHDENADLLPTISYVLVLRQWSALQPSKEYRCFVRNNQIIGLFILKDEKKKQLNFF